VPGTIFDTAGGRAQCTVTAINSATDIERSMTTASGGMYSLQEPSVGTYKIRVGAKRFKLRRTVGVVLDANSALLLDITLSLGGRTDAVLLARLSHFRTPRPEEVVLIGKTLKYKML